MDKALVFGCHPPKIVRSNRIVVVNNHLLFSLRKPLLYLPFAVSIKS